MRAANAREAATRAVKNWVLAKWEVTMRGHGLILAAAAAAFLGGALVLGPSGAMAASVSQNICEGDGGTWDKSTKTCTYPVVETKPGNNQGNANWETEESDTAHGNLKNPKSTNDSSCEGPGNSTSQC